MKKILWILAIGFGIGLCPVASGTAGTFFAFLLLFIFSLSPYYFYLYMFFFAFFFITSIPASNVGIELTNNNDPKEVVIDEILGSFFTLCFINLYSLLFISKIKILLIGFLIFRLFDILKPFPIRKLELLKNGLGVVADDVLAGIYSNIILLLLIKFLL